MIRSVALTLAVITAAGPAAALSCLRPDAVRMFEYARDSADIYYVIKGRLTALGPYAIPSSENGKDNSADTPVQITGSGLSSQGFSVPVDISATLRLNCLAVWCASPPADEELLMIVKKAEDALILEVGPCGGTAVNWDKDAEERLLKCHMSKVCVAASH